MTSQSTAECNNFFCTPVGITVAVLLGIALIFLFGYFAIKKVIPFIRKQRTYLVKIRKIPMKNAQAVINTQTKKKAPTKFQVEHTGNSSHFVMMENTIEAGDTTEHKIPNIQDQSQFNDISAIKPVGGKGDPNASELFPGDLSQILNQITLRKQGSQNPNIIQADHPVDIEDVSNNIELDVKDPQDDEVVTHEEEVQGTENEDNDGEINFNANLFYADTENDNQANTVRIVSELTTPTTGTFNEKVLQNLEGLKDKINSFRMQKKMSDDIVQEA